MTHTYGFNARARLKSGLDFKRVFDSGRKAVGKALIVWHRTDSSHAPPRIGLSVSSKIGGAVRRSRLKRLLRESFRLRQNELPRGLEIVVYPRAGCAWSNRADAASDLFGLLRRAGVMTP